ncbi:tetratricopeptide repeat protein [Geopsychrobacter electrodiphilus]|uniref:tetratricopeptide repeat protein n=1 Tax=Geopsychrobacter electrodiphilus TaxID=225196 RepID=UPI00035E5AA8|nr:hypothetical protein [Geopsychrobacter electrodiphilus]
MAERQQNSLLGKIAAYTEILASDPRSTIFVSLSEAYRKMGMLEDADAVATQGINELPDYCPGHVVLARIKCQQDDLKGSELSFTKALSLDSDNLAALVGFSRVCLLQERRAEARALLLRAREISPADSVINKLLLGLPESEPDPKTSVSPAELNVEPSSPITSEPFESATLADLYRKQGLTSKALEIYRNLLVRDPDNLEYRRCIRDIEIATSLTSPSPSVPINVSPEQQGFEDILSTDLPSPVEEMSNLDKFTSFNNEDVGASVLAKLNRLLFSIQERRGDV